MSYWVVDANIAVQTAIGITDNLEQFWEQLNREQITPCAPRLLLSETTSALRFLVSQKALTAVEAEEALQTIHGLHIEIINEDEALCLRALELAGKLGHSKAYDSIYLALAEKLGVDFWTMDERLFTRCRKDLKMNWVHPLAEIQTL
jgi:predicted nucleic acid-binding protein